jgi:hypothetical protein
MGVLVIDTGGKTHQIHVFAVEPGLVAGISVDHSSIPCRTFEGRVMVVRCLDSRGVSVIVANTRGSRVPELKIGGDLLAHVESVRIAIPKVIEGKSPGNPAGVVLVITASLLSRGSVHGLRG